MVNPALLALLGGAGKSLAPYKLQKEYSGMNFFGDWEYFQGRDAQNGHVQWMNSGDANLQNMTGFLSTDQQRASSLSGSIFPDKLPAFIGVDDTTVLDTKVGRKTVQLKSYHSHAHTLIIADFYRMPEGCGTWPVFRLSGSSQTRSSTGEIDIIEGVNDITYNHYTIHTARDLTITNTSATSSIKAKVYTTNCNDYAPNQDPNAGCSIHDTPDIPSFGKNFNRNGGGVFAIQYTPATVKIWFFPRAAIPSDIVTGKPSPPTTGSDSNNWGLPNALFTPDPSVPLKNDPNDISTILDDRPSDLRIILGTNLCGIWGSDAWSKTNTGSTCGSLAPTCEEFVSRNPAAFQQAYWAVNGIRVYSQV